MRVSEAGLALVCRTGADGGTEYLTQWSARWERLSLVGGHVEPGETFRACCVREVEEELEIAPGTDFRVAPEPVVPLCKYTAMSGSAKVDTEYRVQLFGVELLTDEARGKVAANPAIRWLTESEIEQLRARDGRAVSEQVRTVLRLCGVI